MQNVVYTGRTSEYYSIIQRRREEPGQAEGGLQENNSTDQEDEQTLPCTHSQFSPELLKRGLRRGLQLCAAAAALRAPQAQSFTMLIWKLEHPLNEGRQDWPADRNNLSKIRVHHFSIGSTEVPFCTEDFQPFLFFRAFKLNFLRGANNV